MTADSQKLPRRSRAAGGIVVHAGTGRILVVNQNGDSWSLPKGHVEAGENDLETARREIEEEAGVTVLVLVRPLGEYERHAIAYGGHGENHDELKTLVFFLFTTNQDALAPKDPQNPEARWVERSAVPAMLTHEKDADFFRSVVGSLPL